MEKLSKVTNTMNVRDLPPALVKELQTALKVQVDGVVGEETLAAFAKFKAEVFLVEPEKIGKSSIAALIEKQKHKHVTAEHTTPSILNLDVLPDKALLYPGFEVILGESILPKGDLTWAEFTHSGTRLPNSMRLVHNAIKTAQVFQWIRDKYGSPIAINSAYRPPKINQAVGGSKQSYHMSAQALDLSAPDLNKLLSIVQQSPATGIGLGMHKGFIHIDTRPTADKVVFPY
jgi:peptidoglycan hydrolase-like protein with peptidoglycan-binding domain